MPPVLLNSHLVELLRSCPFNAGHASCLLVSVGLATDKVFSRWISTASHHTQLSLPEGHPSLFVFVFENMVTILHSVETFCKRKIKIFQSFSIFKCVFLQNNFYFSSFFRFLYAFSRIFYINQKKNHFSDSFRNAVSEEPCRTLYCSA